MPREVDWLKVMGNCTMPPWLLPYDLKDLSWPKGRSSLRIPESEVVRISWFGISAIIARPPKASICSSRLVRGFCMLLRHLEKSFPADYNGSARLLRASLHRDMCHPVESLWHLCCGRQPSRSRRTGTEKHIMHWGSPLKLPSLADALMAVGFLNMVYLDPALSLPSSAEQ